MACMQDLSGCLVGPGAAGPVLVPPQPAVPPALVLLYRPELWMTAAPTLLIFAPWLCIWRVPVETIVPSNGNVVLKFGGGMANGVLGRVSRHVLLEYHAFGILSKVCGSPAGLPRC